MINEIVVLIATIIGLVGGTIFYKLIDESNGAERFAMFLLLSVVITIVATLFMGVLGIA